ncbi:MAG: S8 family peptidase [Bacteroidetes bacterium]|nr:S8 family peptidase [Bacteroidota bacterium]
MTHSIRTYSIALLLAALGTVAFAQQPQSFTKGGAVFQQNFLYIKFKPSSKIVASHLHAGTTTGFADLDRAFETIGVRDIQPFLGLDGDDPRQSDGFVKTIANIVYSNEGLSAERIESMLMTLPEVELVSRRFIFKPCYQPNDPHFTSGDQYGLNLMSVPTAWNTTKGSSSVVLAVLDEGTNYLHEDLMSNLQTNPGEMGTDSKGKDKRSNGVDDDGDGYVDNWHGWDLGSSSGADHTSTYKGDNDPMPGPNEGHGTFVAGCLAATPDNGLGVAGVGFNCHYLPIKCTADTGKNAGNISFGYEGITYAAMHGARVINCSWGGDASGATPSDIAFLNSIIDYATAHNALVVAAAGNNSANIDATPFIPASLDANVLTVGASDENDHVTGFSNYGHRVDVYAPGANIWSTEFPGNSSYGSSGGTSFSCPYTVGVAGLLASRYPNWTPKILKSQIVSTVDALKSPTDRNLYWGRVNAANALIPAKTPALVISSYSVDGTPSGTLNYLNKQYALSITFRNLLGNNGNALSVRLVQQGGYTVQQASASFGALNTDATANGVFKFTRDSSDDGMQLPMVFYVTDGAKYKDSLYLTLEITGDNVWVDTTKPNLSINSYSIDGKTNGSLDYINKQYDLSVTFKNTGGAANFTATLLPKSGYTVHSTAVSLGTIASGGTKSGDFLFVRDTTDNGKQLPMDIQVQSSDYSATLHLTVSITGDNVYVDAVPTVSGNRTSDLRVSPNPASTVAMAYFNLAGESRVAISISDMLGRTVGSYDAGVFAAGANRWELPVAGLASGVYIVRLQTGEGDILVSRVVIK